MHWCGVLWKELNKNLAKQLNAGVWSVCQLPDWVAVSPAEVMQMHRSRSSLLLLAAVMAMTDKHIIAITCWLCDPCQEPSTWKTCHGDMCHNITDKHRRGTPDTRSFRQKLRQKNQWDLFYRVHIKKVPLIFFAVTFTNIDGFSYFFRVSLQHGDRVTCTMCRCPILLKNVVIPENRADIQQKHIQQNCIPVIVTVDLNPWFQEVQLHSTNTGHCHRNHQRLCSGVVVWMHVFAWMVDILNINFEPQTFCCFVCFIDTGFHKCANIGVKCVTFVSETFTRYGSNITNVWQ